MPIALREPTGSITPHILLLITQFIALTSPRFPFRRHVFTALLLALFTASRIHPHFSNDLGLVQPFILAWSTFLSSLEKIALSGDEGPEHYFWRVDRPAHEAEQFGAFGPKKLKWAVALLFNMRGVRWNYEVKNVPRPIKATKGRFLVNQVVSLVYYVAMADVVSQIWYHLYFSAGAEDTKHLSLTTGSPLRSFIATLTFGLMPYYMIQIQYVACAIPAVLLGISKPEVLTIYNYHEFLLTWVGLASVLRVHLSCDHCERVLGQVLASDCAKGTYHTNRMGIMSADYKSAIISLPASTCRCTWDQARREPFCIYSNLACLWHIWSYACLGHLHGAITR
jgi:hypothetical protein